VMPDTPKRKRQRLLNEIPTPPGIGIAINDYRWLKFNFFY
jgi:hypothetical protein